MKNIYDVLILGGGGAGIAAADGAKNAGAKKIAMVEERNLGGECPNRACVPTKAMLAGAKLFHAMREDGASFGVRARGLKLDFSALMGRKDHVRSMIVGKKRMETLLKHDGIELMKGRGIFKDAHTVRVGSRTIHARTIVIATGSHDIVPPIAGIDDTDYLTYEDAVDLKRLPRSLAILGGGPVGCEFATFFGQLGVKTFLFQQGAALLSREDEELALLAQMRLRDLGVTVFTKTKTLGMKRLGRDVELTYQTGGEPRERVRVSHVLLAVGKKPKIEGLELNRANVRMKKGVVSVNAFLQTNVKHIFLAGDVSGRLLFTHTAHYEGYVAGWNAAQGSMGGTRFPTDLRVIPRVTFVDPELASVGMTVKEAVEAGRSMRIFKAPMEYLSRACIDGKREGLMKVIVDRETDEILGVHMMGERAGEVIHELALAMRHRLPFRAVKNGIRAYPTYSEIISLLEE